MRYAKINEAIWGDSRFKSVSDSAKLLYIYLLSCSVCNSVGIFRIGMGMIEDDTDIERPTIKAALGELESNELISYRGGWVWFNRYLRWNEPTSPNHARRCADELAEVSMKGAPKEALCSFLGSTKVTLSGITLQKAQDGKKRTYFDEFIDALDKPLIAEFVGGAENLKKCLENGTCNTSVGTIGSTPNIIGRPSNNSGSTPNKIDTKTITITSTRQLQDNTKQDNTRLVLDCKNNEPSERLILCSDGIPHAIGADAIRLAMDQFGDKFDSMINEVQKAVVFGKMPRPNPTGLDDWFLRITGMRSAT